MSGRSSFRPTLKLRPAKVQKPTDQQVQVRSPEQSPAQREKQVQAQKAKLVFESKILELDDAKLQILINVVSTFVKRSGREDVDAKKPYEATASTNEERLEKSIVDEELEQNVARIVREIASEPNWRSVTDEYFAAQTRLQTPNEKKLLPEAVEIIVKTSGKIRDALSNSRAEDRNQLLESAIRNDASIEASLKEVCLKVLPNCDFRGDGRIHPEDIDTDRLRLDTVEVTDEQVNHVTEARRFLERIIKYIPKEPRQIGPTIKRQKKSSTSKHSRACPYEISVRVELGSGAKGIEYVLTNNKEKNLAKRESTSPKMKVVLFLLEDAVGKRRETLLLVTNKILEFQKKFFRRGVELATAARTFRGTIDIPYEYITPMTKESLGKSIGKDATTVSRAIKGKSIDTNFGVISFDYFFTASVLLDANNEKIHPEKLKNAIAKLIAGESPAAPLSDERLAKLLVDNNIVAAIARETVKKYRNELHIKNSWERKTEQ